MRAAKRNLRGMDRLKATYAYFRQASPVLAGVLGMAAYALVLWEYWPWWIVALAVPFALFVAVTFFVILSCNDGWLSRLVQLVLGTGAVVVGVVEPGRLGTLLVGVGVLLVTLCPAPPSPRPTDFSPPG